MTATRTPIDPRIHQRRAKVRRDDTRWRRRIIHALVVVMLLGSAGVAVTRTPLLDVDHIRVEGAARVRAVDVVEAAGIERGTQMVEQDLAAAAAGVAAIPWVDRATVSRHWPGTIRIAVTERVPVAYIAGDEGGGVLVDARRRVLTSTGEDPLVLVQLEGASADDLVVGRHVPASLQPALDVAAALPPSLVARVSTVAIDDGEITAELTEGGQVLLGRPDELGQKLVALATMLGQVDLQGVESIDLRVPDAPVVTR